MAKAGTYKNTAKACRECARWSEISERVRVHELLEKTLEKFEVKINADDYQPSVAEYVKLLQLGREIGQEDAPKEIKVTWVVPTEPSESEK